LRYIKADTAGGSRIAGMFIRFIRSILARAVVALFFSTAVFQGVLADTVPHAGAGSAVTPAPSAVGPAPKGFMDGSGLENDCGVSLDDPDNLAPLCLGYLAGSLDQIMARAGRATLGRSLCPPADLKLGAVKILVLQYLAAYPEERTTAAALIVERATSAAYACADGSDLAALGLTVAAFDLPQGSGLKTNL
jgi:hypothetical protein